MTAGEEPDLQTLIKTGAAAVPAVIPEPTPPSIGEVAKEAVKEIAREGLIVSEEVLGMFGIFSLVMAIVD